MHMRQYFLLEAPNPIINYVFFTNSYLLHLIHIQNSLWVLGRNTVAAVEELSLTVDACNWRHCHRVN